MPDPHWQGPPWARGGPGWGPGRHVFRRMIGFVLFLILAGWLLGFAITTAFSLLGGPRRLIFAGLAALFVIVFVLVVRRVFSRTWAPVGELIDATQRLGDGETGVRIQVRAPGPLAAVGGSFNRMAARLEEEDERRRRLLADLGHELRTPLTVIRGEIEAVIDGLHDPESLRMVIDEVDLMERLLEDLRLLSLAEAGRLQLHTEPVDVEALIDDVISSVATSLEAQRVEPVISVAPEVPEIIADPLRLRQVLGNLVSNALRQMPDGGTLSMTATRDRDSLVVEVADTGSGIPADRVERVFDRFVKGGDSAGTGLGLSIARDLVEAHGGTIAAANRPEGGAMFTIRLPIATDPGRSRVTM